MSKGCFLGVDVGTGSARAGLFTVDGERLAVATAPIELWRPAADHVEQSSDDIWSAVCRATRQAVAEANVDPASVRGIGFDATCSLVVLDEHDQPVTVSTTGRDQQNVIVWMDHRAAEQARAINDQGHDVLRYVGGQVSPEMQTPKLLWLKQHLPASWRRARRFLDLPDYLVYRAAHCDVRSLCTTVCKWTYLGHEAGQDGRVGRWDRGYLQQIGLGDLAEEDFARIGQVVAPMGQAVDQGLTAAAARELGLAPGAAVSVAIIDAHAGGLGLLGARLDGQGLDNNTWRSRLALIGGTSSCHMAVSPQPQFIPGVWGPYYSAMVPGYWLTEGGQSASGALIDHVIDRHARGRELADEAQRTGRTRYELLNDRLEALATARGCAATELTRELHVFPDFHGNRSPRADASLKGMISGLTLDDSLDALALEYLAAIQGVAHGTRHIIDTLNAHDYDIQTLLVCGGGTKNPHFLREHADATGCRLVLPREPEAVLLGGAMLGAVAAGVYASIPDAMAAMAAADQVIEPDPAIAAYHRNRHRVYQRMYDDQLAYRRMMDEAVSASGAMSSE